jgi:tetratricopeptide (TPR) repeat protein
VLIGEGDRAASLYDEVLSQRGDDQRALAGLAQHHAASGNRVAALALRRQLARGVEDPEERYAALIEVAEAFVTKAKDDVLAAEVYEEARALRPRELPLLHKLLALYQKLSAWPALFDVLKSIAEVDADPTRRSKTYFTMAQIAQVELMDRGAALSLFEQALDVDPSALEAFERIASMLTETRDWSGLEQMYKRMILRSTGAEDAKLQHALYQQLGLLYRDRLGSKTLAIQAFQAAARLRPDDETSQTMLRELLAKTGQTEGAVQVTLDRILRDPMDGSPYPALFDLLASRGDRDRALCVASAMKLLGVQHAAATGMRASFPQPPIEAIVMDLGPDGYRELLHPELDPQLTEIFDAIAPALVDVALARLPLTERLTYPGPALKEPAFIGKMVARAAAVLGAPAPKLYQRRLAGPAFAPAPTKPPSLLVYPPAFGGLGRELLTFIVGKRIMELTPPLLARALCPSITELKALAATAARIATKTTEPADAAIADRLSREAITRIARAVETSMSRTGKLDVYRWSQLADVTTSRAGLLLCGDLEAARAALAHEPQAPGDLSPRDKMRELVLFFLGDASATLRRRLGVALT